MSSSVYISGTGSDANAGTRVSPWLTISKAYSSSAAGDTIVLLSGTNTSWASQTFASARTIAADVPGSGLSILDGSSGTIVWQHSANLTVNGITFQNADASFGPSANGITAAYTNCWFKGLSTTSTNILHGLTFVSPTSTITCTGCLFTDPLTGVFGAMFGDTGNSVSYNLYNNTIYTNHADATTTNIFRGGTSAVLKNNIIWNANASTHAFEILTVPTTYSGSVASSNLIRGYNVTTSLVGALTSDPLFVNASSNNFNLRPTSPCIDTGVII